MTSAMPFETRSANRSGSRARTTKNGTTTGNVEVKTSKGTTASAARAGATGEAGWAAGPGRLARR